MRMRMRWLLWSCWWSFQPELRRRQLAMTHLSCCCCSLCRAWNHCGPNGGQLLLLLLLCLLLLFFLILLVAFACAACGSRWTPAVGWGPPEEPAPLATSRRPPASPRTAGPPHPHPAAMPSKCSSWPIYPADPSGFVCSSARGTGMGDCPIAWRCHHLRRMEISAWFPDCDWWWPQVDCYCSADDDAPAWPDCHLSWWREVLQIPNPRLPFQPLPLTWPSCWRHWSAV